MQVANTCWLRRFYPKTSVPAAQDDYPVNFRSVKDVYRWPNMFLEKAASCFGVKWVAQRLRRWKWELSTAFSGVGCAESVRSLVTY